MKRLVRSAIDPLPRILTVKSLALLVGMLLSGVGISVHEYLQSSKVPDRAIRGEGWAPAECSRRNSGRAESAPAGGTGSNVVGRACETPSACTDGEPLTDPRPRPTSGLQPSAASQWNPDSEAPAEEIRSRSTEG